MSPRSIGVLFGGPSPEHSVSVLTGLQAAHALGAGGLRVRALYWTRGGAIVEVDPRLEAEAFLDSEPPGAQTLELRIGDDGGFYGRRGRFGAGRERLELDVIVVCCHGGPGEGGALQSVLDLANLPYTGPSAAGAALGMDKLATAGVLQTAAVPVLARRLLAPGEGVPPFAGPYIVKPRFGGSSIGIEVVADYETALRRSEVSAQLREGAVIEPFRPDLYDLQIAVRSYPSLELSAIERPIRQREGAEILDFRDKYVGGEGMASAPRELPAALPPALADRVRELARRAAALLGVRGIARADFLTDGADELYLNEVNTIPGSLSRYLFIDPPRSFAELLDDLVAEALARPAARHSASGDETAVLRSAASIASKLG